MQRSVGVGPKQESGLCVSLQLAVKVTELEGDVQTEVVVIVEGPNSFIFSCNL